MRRRGLAAACFVLLLPLAGCGSGTSAPLAVSCTVSTLPSGALRAAVTVSSSLSTAHRAFVYGPAFSWTQEIHPLLNPAQVVVHPSSGRPVSYFGYTVPNVPANKSAHVVFVFRPPPSPKSIAVATSQTVTVADSTVNNADCTIGGK